MTKPKWTKALAKIWLLPGLKLKYKITGIVWGHVKVGGWIRKHYIGILPLISIGWGDGSVRVYFEWFCFVGCVFFWRKNA